MQLRFLNEEESALDYDLDALLRDQTNVDKPLERLIHYGMLSKESVVLTWGRPKFRCLSEDVEAIDSVVEKTSVLAEKISERVRVLDLQQVCF